MTLSDHNVLLQQQAIRTTSIQLVFDNMTLRIIIIIFFLSHCTVLSHSKMQQEVLPLPGLPCAYRITSSPTRALLRYR